MEGSGGLLLLGGNLGGRETSSFPGSTFVADNIRGVVDPRTLNNGVATGGGGGGGEGDDEEGINEIFFFIV